MKDFSYAFVKEVTDGNLGWKDPRPRGHIKIKEDNKTLYYKLMNRSELKEFKLWFEGISEREYGNKARLIGKYPEYQLHIGEE